MVTFTLYDEKELMFSTEKVMGPAGSHALCTNNPQLIKLTTDYFELRWQAAAKEYFLK
jgi:hypothetical protein